MASVTIYDVAARAGVSIKTVSRVMNAGPNVSAETRQRVQVAAEALGYHPNLSARSLAGSRSFVIAAFVDAALTVEHWRSDRGAAYLSRVQLGATQACRAAGYHFLVELIDHAPDRVRADVQRLLGALKPDGVILTPPSSDHPVVLDLLRSARTPFVRLGAQAEATEQGGLRLVMQDNAAALGMTEHLIGLGHRRIGFIMGEAGHGSSHARREGFLTAMAGRGLEVAPGWLRPGDFTYDSGMAAARAMLALADRPTAIFAGNDDMALGCLASAAEAGLSVPGDLSVAGFDGSAASLFSRPTLTTIRQPIAKLATYAAEALIAGAVDPARDSEAPADLVDPYRLILGGSTGPAPALRAREVA